MSFLSNVGNSRKKRQELSTLQSQKQRDEYLAELDNPESNTDEVSRFIKLLCLPAFAIWVAYLGYLYTADQLEGAVSPTACLVLSIALPVIVQCIKLYMAKKVLRAWFFGWYDRSGYEFSYWVVASLLVVGAFAWSLKISVWDVKSTVEKTAMAEKPLLVAYLAEQTKQIDAQIADVAKSNVDAVTIKTKSGKIASSGRMILTNNSATLADLQASRKEIVSNATTEFNTRLKDLEAASVSKGNFFTRFGGWGEIGEILFCLLLGLTEAINRNSNKERLGNHPTPPNNGERRYDPENQNTTRRDHVQAYRSRSNTAPENCVTSDTTVSQNLNISVDDILRHGRTSLLREIANLKNDSGKTKTVAYRIYGILNRVGRFASQKNFESSDEVILSFFTVLNDSLHALKEKGMPYEYESQITRQFEKLLPEQEMTA